MRQKTLITVALVAVFAITGAAVAAGPDEAQPRNGSGSGVQAQNQGETTQFQNQAQVQNQGETSQVRAQEQSAAQQQGGAGPALAEQRRSRVANAVQAMLRIAERHGGIGEQVRVIAQTQTQNQEKLEAGLSKLGSRNGLVKFFIGPDYQEIKDAVRSLEQNRERVRLLEEVKGLVADPADLQDLEGQLSVLEQTNQEIEDAVTQAGKGFSLLGWMFRLLAK